MNTIRFSFALLFSTSLLFGASGFAEDTPVSDDDTPVETCFSIQPHVSDAWCQAVACDPIYAAFCATGEAEPTVDPPPVEPEVEECVSAAPHISNAWCEAVACAPVFVEAGLCAYE